MNPHYSAFIDLGKALAAERALLWKIPLNTDGTAADGVGWNLTAAAKAISIGQTRVSFRVPMAISTVPSVSIQTK